MEKLHFTMEFRNRTSGPLSLDLEPNPDTYTLQPGVEVALHAICSGDTKRHQFHVQFFPESSSGYPPGMGARCEEFFAALNEKRLAPDS